MKICFVADARSAIARNWIQWFVERQHSVCVISSYSAPPDSIPGCELHCVPLLVNRFARIRHNGSVRSSGAPFILSRFLAELQSGRLSHILRGAKVWAAPLELPVHRRECRKILDDFCPDIVHAMRIPYEGMLASLAIEHLPFVISIWGNDLTLHASRSHRGRVLTRRSLGRADGLHSDCKRDIRLAQSQWGFAATKPTIVLPGGGGIQIDRFFPGPASPQLLSKSGVLPGVPVVVNPRGFRPGSVRSDTFFRAIPIVLRTRPDAVFVALGMAENPIAERWIKRYNLSASVRLLGSLTRDEMAEIFRLAWINLSISEHDGLPNTLLESMASGAFPIVGNIESLREWIDHGVNGFLVPPDNPDAAAAAVLQAIHDTKLRQSAAFKNRVLIENRADHSKVMPLAERFYSEVIDSYKESRSKSCRPIS